MSDAWMLSGSVPLKWSAQSPSDGSTAAAQLRQLFGIVPGDRCARSGWLPYRGDHWRHASDAWRSALTPDLGPAAEALRRTAPAVGVAAALVVPWVGGAIAHAERTPSTSLAAAQLQGADRSGEASASRGAVRTPAAAVPTPGPRSTVLPASMTTASTSTTSGPTTLKPKPPTTTMALRAAAAAPSTSAAHREVGKASYYDYKAGGCAHKTLPKGTVVTVTNTANGASTTCVVNDRGPFVAGRIIDLDRSVFTRIASTSSGVVPVEIRW